jgi:hypothetical protein
MQDETLVSIAAAARERGISRQALHKAVTDGLVPAHLGPRGRRMVRLSEVRASGIGDSKPEPEPMVRISEVVADLAALTEQALAKRGAAIHLDHLQVKISRADAERLLALYQDGSGATNLARIRKAHQALGVPAD